MKKAKKKSDRRRFVYTDADMAGITITKKAKKLDTKSVKDRD